jgi:hypothetical protein
MASTYINDLRLNEMATGDGSGTWGTTTNTNLELIAEAFSYGTEVITTNADTHTTTIADGATDPGRSLYLKYTGTLDSACTITIGPNTVSKVWIIENGTSGSQNIIISQGSGANITIPAGDTKVVYSDGAGAGAAFFDAFASLSVVDLKVQDDLTVTDAALVTGVLTTTATQVATGGITSGSDIISDTDSTDSLGSTGVRWLKGWFDTLTAGTLTVGSGSVTDSSGAISFGDENLTTTGIVTAAGTSVFTNLDISGDIDVDGTTNLDVVDIDGALTQDGGAVFNETGADVDFRVESDTVDHALFVQGSDGFVGIGTSSPAAKLQVGWGSDQLQFTNPTAGKKRIGATYTGYVSDNIHASMDLQSAGSSGGDISFNTTPSGGSLTERLRIDEFGNVGIGTSSPGSLLQVGANNDDPATIQVTYSTVPSYLSNTYDGSSGLTSLSINKKNTSDGSASYSASANISYCAAEIQLTSRTNGSDIIFKNHSSANTDPTEKIRIDSSGNLLVGTTSGSTHIIKRAVSVGSLVLEIIGNNLGTRFFNADGGSPNAGNSAQHVYSVGATGRSINAAGTVNASGADYAEYMKKSDSCGTIAKGDVCGVDSTGKLTDVFENAISFVIKSTDPSYVGGDAWGGTELELTEEQYETERQKYDRIAFSGQVPVNITGSFNVGDYVYPQVNGTAIECVAKSSPTFEEYQLCVGKIWATQDDGRPFVAVKIG